MKRQAGVGQAVRQTTQVGLFPCFEDAALQSTVDAAFLQCWELGVVLASAQQQPGQAAGATTGRTLTIDRWSPWPLRSPLSAAPGTTTTTIHLSTNGKLAT